MGEQVTVLKTLQPDLPARVMEGGAGTAVVMVALGGQVGALA